MARMRLGIATNNEVIWKEDNPSNFKPNDFFVCVVCEGTIVSKAKDVCEFCVIGEIDD